MAVEQGARSDAEDRFGEPERVPVVSALSPIRA
jgi:hypothetical protein